MNVPLKIVRGSYRTREEMESVRLAIVELATEMHLRGVVVQRELAASLSEQFLRRRLKPLAEAHVFKIINKLRRDGELPDDWFYNQVRASEEKKTRVFELAKSIYDDGEGNNPFTLRQLYYRCVVEGLLDKTDGAYTWLCTHTGDMRKDGTMPYEWFLDSTRVTHWQSTYDSPEDAIEQLADQYVEDPWEGRDDIVEIWTEKDALSNVLLNETWHRYIPLRVARGYTSLTGLHRAAEAVRSRSIVGQATHVFYLRDRDTAGVAAAIEGERMLREMLSNEKINLPPFTILGVTDEQVESNKWNLQAALREDKETEELTAIEVDAIPPAELRKLVRQSIAKFLPERELKKHESRVAKVRERLRCAVLEDEAS